MGHDPAGNAAGAALEPRRITGAVAVDRDALVLPRVGLGRRLVRHVLRRDELLRRRRRVELPDLQVWARRRRRGLLRQAFGSTGFTSTGFGGGGGVGGAIFSTNFTATGFFRSM